MNQLPSVYVLGKSGAPLEEYRAATSTESKSGLGFMLHILDLLIRHF